MRQRRMSALLAAFGIAALLAAPAGFATGGGGGGGGGEEPLKCNSGRGNGSEGSASQLLVPGTDTGPGVYGTVDCDPGNSGAVNRGGD